MALVPMMNPGDDRNWLFPFPDVNLILSLLSGGDLVKLLVTGGAGFIGSNFVRYMLKTRKEIAIVNLDKLTYAGSTENLTEVAEDPRYKFVKGDIANAEVVGRILEAGVHAVVNLAAETHVDRSILNSAPFLHTNVLGTACLLHAAQRNGVTQFVHISSDEVYGSVPKGEFRKEEAALSPNSPYAASKAAADHLVCAYRKTYGFPGVILRSANNYGPFQFPEKFIPLMISNAFEEKRLPVYGDGEHERDWMYVEDFCRAIAVALETPEIKGIYNVAAHQHATNLQVVGEILNQIGKPASLLTHVQDRPGHDRRYAIDTSRFRHAANWAPEISFPEGLRKTIAWYEANRTWLQRARSGAFGDFYERNYEQREETLSTAKRGFRE
jgi:dTDP-glucose 4,6-dehydratase